MGINFEFDMSKVKRAVGEQIAKAEINVPCPNCGVKNRVRGRDVAREGTFTCTGCHKRIKIHDEGDGFARIIRGR